MVKSINILTHTMYQNKRQGIFSIVALLFVKNFVINLSSHCPMVKSCVNTFGMILNTHLTNTVVHFTLVFYSYMYFHEWNVLCSLRDISRLNILYCPERVLDIESLHLILCSTFIKTFMICINVIY